MAEIRDFVRLNEIPLNFLKGSMMSRMTACLTKCSVLNVFLGLAITASIAIAADEKEEKHDHPDKGPHKGALIELGEEEYHAELVHDDEANTITVYILDSSAKKAVPIDSKQILINVKHGKKVEQFKLASSPDKGDAKGLSSRFTLKDKELCEHLDEENVEARLSLKIKGKSYAAKLAHDHDHDHEKENK